MTSSNLSPTTAVAVKSGALSRTYEWRWRGTEHGKSELVVNAAKDHTHHEARRGANEGHKENGRELHRL